MYKSLIFTAVALYDGVAAQNMTVDGINYSCSESKGCYSIDVSKDFEKETLTWQTLLDGAAEGGFHLDKVEWLRVHGTEMLQEINFSDAPVGTTITPSHGGGGLEIFALPSLHTIKLGGFTEIDHVELAGDRSSLNDCALNFTAPHLKTVKRTLTIRYLNIDEITFDALQFIGNGEIANNSNFWSPASIFERFLLIFLASIFAGFLFF